MKQFNLEEYLANPSRKIVTRDGKAVEILCTNYIGTQPIIASVEDIEYSTAFCKDGRRIIGGESSCDLFFAPEKKVGWVNVFGGTDGNSYVGDSRIFKSKEDAEKEGKKWSDYIATVKIEWED